MATQKHGAVPYAIYFEYAGAFRLGVDTLLTLARLHAVMYIVKRPSALLVPGLSLGLVRQRVMWLQCGSICVSYQQWTNGKIWFVLEGQPQTTVRWWRAIM